ncbi:MAG: hypothetical protein Ct9H300mP23_06420 [Nitrospinota bacterium]|nr:MAG: hypothetical protein Ct9H300mP23_06420 [Nitrospinota bacterium]
MYPVLTKPTVCPVDYRITIPLNKTDFGFTGFAHNFGEESFLRHGQPDAMTPQTHWVPFKVSIIEMEPNAVPLSVLCIVFFQDVCPAPAGETFE